MSQFQGYVPGEGSPRTAEMEAGSEDRLGTVKMSLIGVAGVAGDVNVTDRAARDIGKVDVASLDQYTPKDMDSGAGTVNALPVVLKATGAGSADLGTSGTPIRTDPTGTTAQPVTDNAGSLTVDDGAGSLTVDGTVSIQDGGNVISVDDGAGSLTVDGSVTIQEPLSVDDNGSSLTVDGSVSLVPLTAGGLSVYRNIDLDETGVLVKNAAGQVYGWYIYNAATAARFIRIYDHADAPASGDTPLLTIPLPAGSAANVFSDVGIPCTNGIGVRATTAVADNDTGAPSANDVVINLFYK